MASLISLLIAGLLARLGAAQQAGWVTGQVNTTMCQWPGPRGMFTGFWGPWLLKRSELTEIQLLLYATLCT